MLSDERKQAETAAQKDAEGNARLAEQEQRAKEAELRVRALETELERASAQIQRFSRMLFSENTQMNTLHTSKYEQTNAEANEQLEAQQKALRENAFEERTALERRVAELGAALDETRAKLATSESREDQLDTRDHSGT